VSTHSVKERGRAGLQSVLVLILAAQLACLPEIKERCPLLTEPTAAPALPHDLAQLDSLLIRRTQNLMEASRELHRFQVWWFRVGFAERILPDLCGRLERARELAMAGRTVEAGRKYQGLLVASQVMHFAIAMHLVAQQADIAGQAGGQITQTISAFADQAKPLYEAALSEDPQRIARTLQAHQAVFREWADYLEQWPVRINAGVERAKAAKLVWDITFLVVATYQAAGAAAEIAAAGRPPMPPLPVALALGTDAAAAGFSEVAIIELGEAIRRLIASGALDAAVVAALSYSMSGGDPSSSAPAAPVTRGALTGSLKGLTAAERSFVEELLTEGKNVEIVARGPGKTADFLVNGVSTELKTLTTASQNTLKNAIEAAAEQGRAIVIDARHVGITPQEAAAQISRAQGNVGGLQGRVTVLTSDGPVTF